MAWHRRGAQAGAIAKRQKCTGHELLVRKPIGVRAEVVPGVGNAVPVARLFVRSHGTGVLLFAVAHVHIARRRVVHALLSKVRDFQIGKARRRSYLRLAAGKRTPVHVNVRNDAHSLIRLIAFSVHHVHAATCRLLAQSTSAHYTEGARRLFATWHRRHAALVSVQAHA